MKQFIFGQIVLVSFPLVSGESGKQRPALVLIDMGDDDVILARITSKLHKSDYDVNMDDWKKAGLIFPSDIRVHKVVAVDKSVIVKVLGKLQASDEKVVRLVARNLWKSL